MQIVKKTLSLQIYEVLKQDILTQKISFGERLINRDLQQKFGVSSTPVRDAINHLYLDGLITDITNVGSKVIEFDLSFALEINEIISILCRGAAHLAMEKANNAVVAAALEECILHQKQNMDNDSYFDFDYEFHKVCFDYSNNARCKRLYKQHNVLQEMLVRYYHTSEKSREHAVSQHQIILEAYKKGDLAAVEQGITDHYNSAAIVLQKALE